MSLLSSDARALKSFGLALIIETNHYLEGKLAKLSHSTLAMERVPVGLSGPSTSSFYRNTYQSLF